jgi:hypothetical protein
VNLVILLHFSLLFLNRRERVKLVVWVSVSVATKFEFHLKSCTDGSRVGLKIEDGLHQFKEGASPVLSWKETDYGCTRICAVSTC